MVNSLLAVAAPNKSRRKRQWPAETDSLANFVQFLPLPRLACHPASGRWKVDNLQRSVPKSLQSLGSYVLKSRREFSSSLKNLFFLLLLGAETIQIVCLWLNDPPSNAPLYLKWPPPPQNKQGWLFRGRAETQWTDVPQTRNAHCILWVGVTCLGTSAA